LFKHDDLKKYLTRFNYEQQDAVVAALMQEEAVKAALETENGKTLLNGMIELIRNNVISIINYSYVEGGQEKIKVLADEINVTRKLLIHWSKIISEGEQHFENMLKQ